MGFQAPPDSARLGDTQLLRKLFQLLPHVPHRSCSILGTRKTARKTFGVAQEKVDVKIAKKKNLPGTMKSVFSSIVNKGPKIMPELQYKLPTSFITHMDFIVLLNKKNIF